MQAEATVTANAPPRVLIVESDPDVRAGVRQFVESELGWLAAVAHDQESAMQGVTSFAPQVVLAEVSPSDSADLPLLDAIKKLAPDLPVVLLMREGSESITLRALRHGSAAGYASANNFAEELPEILERVASAVRSTRDRKRLKSCLTRIDIEFRLENDLTMVPILVAEVQDDLSWLGFLDRSARIRLGVALEEALLNAMVHGNLEVTSDLRQKDESHYHAAIAERRKSRPFSGRKVRFTAKLRADRAVFSVTDQGPGFDPTSLPDPTDPANLERVGGRGLLLIRTFMDEVKFNRKGNRITMTKCQPRAK